MFQYITINIIPVVGWGHNGVDGGGEFKQSNSEKSLKIFEHILSYVKLNYSYIEQFKLC